MSRIAEVPPEHPIPHAAVGHQSPDRHVRVQRGADDDGFGQDPSDLSDPLTRLTDVMEGFRPLQRPAPGRTISEAVSGPPRRSWTPEVALCAVFKPLRRASSGVKLRLLRAWIMEAT